MLAVWMVGGYCGPRYAKKKTGFELTDSGFERGRRGQIAFKTRKFESTEGMSVSLALVHSAHSYLCCSPGQLGCFCHNSVVQLFLLEREDVTVSP